MMNTQYYAKAWVIGLIDAVIQVTDVTRLTKNKRLSRNILSGIYPAHRPSTQALESDVTFIHNDYI